jgi:hypothetical protein
LILVASKCDENESKRKVATSEGQELATKWQCPFFETSSLKHINVDNAFQELVRKMIAMKDKGSVEDEPSGNHNCALL